MNFLEHYFKERDGVSFRNIIVVDVQPLYEEAIERKFDISDFYNFLSKSKRNILYFYNGPETIGSEDSPDMITQWIEEKAGVLEPDFAESVIIKENVNWDNVEWTDKGYSFFRDWMDFSVSVNGIHSALRHMYMTRKYDSREISVDEWSKVLPEKDFNILKPHLETESLTIWTPDISIEELKRNWSGSLLMGGGMNECLKEIQILLGAFNIPYKLVDKFIY